MALAVPGLHAAPSADQAIAKADSIRNPVLDYEVQVKITSYKENKQPKVGLYKTYVKGRDKALVQTLAPAVDRGSFLLMNKENFWAYLPRLSQPVRISMRERLLGEVANGDLVRANFSGDYTPKFAGPETAKGIKQTIVELTPVSEKVTYGKVRLWVEDKTGRPVKAEFFAFSGKQLKTCLYEGYQSFGGEIRPTRLTLTDAVVKGSYSVMEYSDLVVKPIPDKYFSKDFIKKLAE